MWKESATRANECTMYPDRQKIKQKWGGNTDNDFDKEEYWVDDQQCDDAGLSFHRGKQQSYDGSSQREDPNNNLTCLSALYKSCFVAVMSELPSMGEGANERRMLLCFVLRFLWKVLVESRMPSLPQYVTPKNLKMESRTSVGPFRHGLNPPTLIRAKELRSGNFDIVTPPFRCLRDWGILLYCPVA